MVITDLISLFCDLNLNQIKDFKDLEYKYEDVCTRLGCTEIEISANLPQELIELYFSENSEVQWKYIKLNFYILKRINHKLEASKNELLSVNQSKNLKNCITNLVQIGIYCRLLPNVPFHVPPLNLKPDAQDIFFDYNILKCTAFGLYDCLKKSNLRTLILPENLRPILLALYQISYCPLKSPGKTASPLLTEKIYGRLKNEKEMFTELLNKLHQTIHPVIFVKETMIIFQENSPLWFKRAVSQMLTNILLSHNGVEIITMTMLDGVTDDTTKTWKALDIIIKLILSCKKLPDFKTNLCKQVLQLMEKTAMQNQNCLVYEKMYVHLTKTLFSEDNELSKNVFIGRVMNFFLYFTYKGHIFQESHLLTLNIKQNVRLLHSIFVDSNLMSAASPPINLIKSILNVLFRLYCLMMGSETFISTLTELGNILRKYLSLVSKECFILFDTFLFGISDPQILPFRNDLILEIQCDKINLNYTDHVVTYSIQENSDGVMYLIKNEIDLLVQFFGYLLNCVTDREKYFNKAKADLLNFENEIMNEFFERNLVVHKLLSDLAENKDVQKQMATNPGSVIVFIKNVLQKNINNGIHKSIEFESHDFQALFTIIMILQALIKGDSNKTHFEHFHDLHTSLKVIYDETNNQEMKNILNTINEVLKGGGSQKSLPTRIDQEKTKLDRVLENICDPLLPVRGHGLMELTKLIEKMDANALERKQYILNIFQQNLKNEDSYIYLSAVAGLVSMAKIFPDTIVRVLCEEYIDFTKSTEEDRYKVRLEIGEALVRVTKMLGEMAPKYKSQLLNSFLIGAKDEDCLIRASSLSNLGEICRVLGYKLGTVISEVLVCVHAVITTDKSQEARRAAVTVIRQLLIGLDSQIIVFLKEDILPIYRTLKQIYNNDKDDVMRLQAQLALEQLNESMESFVFPQRPLNLEKKIVMLN